ncbi:FYB1 protein, partial [Smithornis capensis]|nr:FYB1 protein [Smithornis capensis]
MEKFNAGNRDTEDVSQCRPLKIPREEIPQGLQQERKAALEKIASQGNATCSPGPSTSSKRVHPKPPLGVKPSIDDKTEHDPKPSHLKPVAQKFGVHLQPTNKGNYGKTECTKFTNKTNDPAKEDSKPLLPKSVWNKVHTSAPPDKEKNPLGAKSNSDFASQDSEAKLAISKVAGIKEKLMSTAQENEPKPPLSKPPLAQKPSLDNEISHNKDTSNKCGFLQSRLSGSRTNIHSVKKRKEMDENNSAAEATDCHFLNTALKPTGQQHSIYQGRSKSVEKKTEEEMSVAKTTVVKKIIQKESDSSSSKFHKVDTVLGGGKLPDESQEKKDGNERSKIPRKRVLTPIFKVPMSPPKPNRPPHVDIKLLLKSNPKPIPSFVTFAAPVPPSHCSAQFPPPPPASHPSMQAPAAPSLPPRNTKLSSETISPENEENYDDVEFVSQGRSKDLLHIIQSWQCTFRSSREKEKKRNKEDKKRMDQEKKEQKEKEKKDQELRKKFKLTGPIEVLHQARACVDYKGGKNELTVKQGDKIEIIRLTDNPEGKWLGRIGGCYGYIKTTIVEIDYDSLKRKQQPSTGSSVKFSESDLEVYDDVGDQDNINRYVYGMHGKEQTIQPLFPPPPTEQEIYDEIDAEDPITRSVSQDEDKDGSWSWGILKRLKVKDDKKKSIREKTTKVNGAEDNGNLLQMHFHQNHQKACHCFRCVANFVLSVTSWFSSSKSASFIKRKSDEKDVQKLKKMEREEKEFRKKFKFAGEIKVLYSTTTVQNLPQKRWGSKDLQIRPGESLDVIESTDDTKVLCRNEEGK